MLQLQAVVNNRHVDSLAGSLVPGVFHPNVKRRRIVQVPLLRVQRIIRSAAQRLTYVRFARKHRRELNPALLRQHLGGIQRRKRVGIHNHRPTVQIRRLRTHRLRRRQLAHPARVHMHQQLGRHQTPCRRHPRRPLFLAHRRQRLRRRQIRLVIKHRHNPVAPGPRTPQLPNTGRIHLEQLPAAPLLRPARRGHRDFAAEHLVGRQHQRRLPPAIRKLKLRLRTQRHSQDHNR